MSTFESRTPPTGRGPKLYKVNLTTGAATPVSDNIIFPVISPDSGINTWSVRGFTLGLGL